MNVRASEPAPVEGEGSAGPPGVGFLLGAAHRAQRRVWEAQLGDLGLTAPQAAVLYLIDEQPGIGVRRLARLLITDAMNAQRITETLIWAGKCEAHADPADARRRPLYVTSAGRRLATEVRRRAYQGERRLRETLGADGYAAMVTGLRRLAAEGLGTGPRADVARAAGLP